MSELTELAKEALMLLERDHTHPAWPALVRDLLAHIEALEAELARLKAEGAAIAYQAGYYRGALSQVISEKALRDLDKAVGLNVDAPRKGEMD